MRRRGKEEEEDEERASPFARPLATLKHSYPTSPPRAGITTARDTNLNATTLGECGDRRSCSDSDT